jgi:hypothetical protein
VNESSSRGAGPKQKEKTHKERTIKTQKINNQKSQRMKKSHWSSFFQEGEAP